MPTELEELVGFIGHGNPQIRQVAVANLVPYSTMEPSIFKANNLAPVKNFKYLVQDRPDIAEHVITILVNLSADSDVLENLASDDKFLERILVKLTKQDEKNANFLAMLLANLAKWDGFKNVLQKKRPAPEGLKSNELVMNQLMDLFVKGADGSYNKRANFDYLAYLFADLAKHAEVRQFLVTKQSYDDAIPITKIKVFTEHKSEIRRRGVASTIKNAAFDVPSHPAFLDEDRIHILPYILLPIMGSEEYDDEEMMDMLPDLQLLPPDKAREPDNNIVQTHVETLTLLTTTRDGRDLMRRVNVYPVIRETHARVNDEGVREACDRLVQVLMRDEEGESTSNGESRITEVDEDNEIVEV